MGWPVTPALAIALGTTMLWAVYIVMTRFALHDGRIDPWAYTLVQLFSGGLFMAWLGRRAKGDWAGLLAPRMLAYGVLRVVVPGATTMALVHLAVAQTSLIGSANMVVAAALAAALRGLVPGRSEVAGLAALAAGIGVVIATAPGGLANPGVWWALLSESLAVLSAYVIEFHPRNRDDDIAARSRFTGELLIVTSLVLAIAWTAAGMLGLTRSPWQASGGGFGDPALWGWGIAAGLLFRGPGTWSGLWLIRHLGTAGFMISLSLLPVLAILAEQAAALAGWMAVPPLPPSLWLGAALIVAASAWLMRLRLRGR